MKRRLMETTFWASTILTAAIPAVALAQEEAAQEDDARFRTSSLTDSIVVTAQKREENIQDVGISMTAFSGKQLKELGLAGTAELGLHVPGLRIVDYGNSTTTVINIRGVSQLDFADHHEPPVAVYQDGVYNSFIAGVGFQMFDLDRVEVLRGPQGTLYGRNATGGLIHLVSAEPTFEPEGYLEVGYARFNDVTLEGAVNGPLSEKLAGRFSFSGRRSDGFIKNIDGEGLNEINNLNLRGQLLYEASDNLTVHLLGRYSKDFDSNAAGYHIRSAILDADGYVVTPANLSDYGDFCNAFLYPSPTQPGATNCFDYVKDPKDVYHTNVDDLGRFNREHWGVTGTVEWKLDDVNVTSITNYQSIKKYYRDDSDASPDPFFIFEQELDADQFSQEIRLDGEAGALRWMVGGFYLKIDNASRGVTDNDGLYGVVLDNQYTLETESWAAFVNLEYNLTDRLKLTTGFRWTEDNKDFTLHPQCIESAFGAGLCSFIFAGTVQLDGIPGAAASRSEGEWSGKFQLDYNLTDDVLFYAGASRGNKAGGYNAGAGLVYLPSEVEFEGEILWSYETGLKSTFMDGRGRFNISGFYYDYNNFQTFSQVGPSLKVFNVDARVIGMEAELAYSPAEGWDVMAGLSYLDAEQKDLPLPNGAFADQPMPNAPKVTADGLVRRTWELANQGAFSVQVDGGYTDERSLAAVAHPALQAPSYFIGNTQLEYVTSDNRWTLRAFVKNFTNARNLNQAFDLTIFTGSVIDTYSPPRTYGFSATYRWGK